MEEKEEGRKTRTKKKDEERESKEVDEEKGVKE